MKSTLLMGALAIFGATTFFSCNREEAQAPAAKEQTEQISEETLSKIKHLGFGTSDVKRIPGGFLVEGDILLTQKSLDEVPDYKVLRVGEQEHYRTFNLVGGLPRTITISMSSTLNANSCYVNALNTAIARYNNQGLLIRFQRVTSGGNINIISGSGSFLASAGFPSGGNPYPQVVVNVSALGSCPSNGYLATILAHEVGHCIGFRHTDYMDRSYSCGGSFANEGASTVGAVHIPGTPTGPDPTSWMLACIGTGQSRPFNANDVTALNYLY
ncbi:MAG: Milk-clotting protease [uncultured Cytophagales bacterium]|uniref:Milk-clotting protease n=1 Tax=uncultured Cytophagales bacterium TaxID=158755 RepID=A0A6J4K7D0_9SPHI|nr:MAG: Milk-clotting protease [uncultured Cytophagales bacterium]